MKKGAIFDMDGTLFDTERLYARIWSVTAEHFGQSPHPDFPFAVAGTGGEGQLEVIRRYYPDVDAQAFREDCVARLEKILQSGLPEKRRVREILLFFRERDVKIAIASSSSHDRILEYIRRAELESFFDVIVSGEDIVHGKPEPDIFLLAANRLGCLPEECYVFEDSINGTRAGIAAGCETFMIQDMFPPTKDLCAGCAGICFSLLEAKHKIEVSNHY